MKFSFQDKGPMLIGGGVALTLLLGGVFIWQKQSYQPSESSSQTVAPVEAAVSEWPEGYEHRTTDGMPVLAKDQPTTWFAVMVENSAEAWPLTGIAEARLVIEAPVEGSIPRLSVYFDDTQDVKKIGPVRSVRPYYLDWSSGQRAMLAHVGGSPEALALVQSRQSITLNEFFWGRFFWRDLSRYAPHNVYTSVGLLKQGYDARGYEAGEEPLPSFRYTLDSVTSATCNPQTSVTVHFSKQTKDYNAQWQYRPETNDYIRVQGVSAESLDTDNDIIAKNIVVLHTDIDVIDAEGRRSVRTVGTGDVTLYRDGFAFEGTWEKSRFNQPLQLKTIDGAELALRPGTTWIEVSPLSTSAQATSAQDCE